MNRRHIITVTILGTCGFIVLLVALIVTIVVLRRRCKKPKTTTQETDKNSIATTTTLEDDGINNLGLDNDGLVSATKRRTPEPRKEKGSLDPKFEEILDNAYADARQFAKFPHMP